MTRRGRSGPAYSVDEFVQRLSSQLDRAQDMLAVKARTGRPLTFALKDLAVDLKVFWESDPRGRLVVRLAQSGEEGASSVKFSFTTITRSAVEENSMALGLEDDPRTLDEVADSEALPEEDRQKLEMAGVRTVGQLKRMSQEADAREVGALLDIPVNRLQRLLQRSSRPAVLRSEPVRQPGRRPLLRIRGANLRRDDPPRVRLKGEAVEVLESSSSELLVRPLSHHAVGELEVQVGPDTAHGFFELEPDVAPHDDDPYAARPSEEAVS